MFSQYFVILLRIFIDRLPSNFFSLLSSGVLNSYTQKHHTINIRESVTGSRLHQNSIAIHQFKRFTVACFWGKKKHEKRFFSTNQIELKYRFQGCMAFLPTPSFPFPKVREIDTIPLNFLEWPAFPWPRYEHQPIFLLIHFSIVLKLLLQEKKTITQVWPYTLHWKLTIFKLHKVRYKNK